MVRITYLQFNLLLFTALLMILKIGFLNECEYGLLIICGWYYLYFSTWNYYKLTKLPSLTGCLWTALRNEKKLHPRWCFCKEQFLLDFFTSKSKNRIENLPIFYIYLNFSPIITNNFRISNSYEIRTKLFRLLIFQRRLISTH